MTSKYTVIAVKVRDGGHVDNVTLEMLVWRLSDIVGSCRQEDVQTQVCCHVLDLLFYEKKTFITFL